MGRLGGVRWAPRPPPDEGRSSDEPRTYYKPLCIGMPRKRLRCARCWRDKDSSAGSRPATSCRGSSGAERSPRDQAEQALLLILYRSRRCRRSVVRRSSGSEPASSRWVVAVRLEEVAPLRGARILLRARIRARGQQATFEAHFPTLGSNYSSCARNHNQPQEVRPKRQLEEAAGTEASGAATCRSGQSPWPLSPPTPRTKNTEDIDCRIRTSSNRRSSRRSRGASRARRARSIDRGRPHTAIFGLQAAGQDLADRGGVASGSANKPSSRGASGSPVRLQRRGASR